MSEADTVPTEERLPWLGEEAEPARDAPHRATPSACDRRRLADFRRLLLDRLAKLAEARSGAENQASRRPPPCRCPRLRTRSRRGIIAGRDGTLDSPARRAASRSAHRSNAARRESADDQRGGQGVSRDEDRRDETGDSHAGQGSRDCSVSPPADRAASSASALSRRRSRRSSAGARWSALTRCLRICPRSCRRTAHVEGLPTGSRSGPLPRPIRHCCASAWRGSTLRSSAGW